MLIGRAKRPPWEKFLVTILVLVSIGFGISIYAKRDQVYKQRLLLSELMTLRNYLTAYYIEHKKFPATLSELHSVETDPFGNPYRYDPKKGWVASQTLGSTDW